jgi:hypothetical protein
VGLEQPSIQEGDMTEPGSGSASAGGRRIESAEEERPEKIAVDPALASQAPIHLLCQEVLSSTEPSLGLDEIEEEDPSELEQGEAVAVFSAHRPWKAGCHAVECRTKPSEEATSYRFGRERICGPRCKGQ